ncbi:hypothetical protein Patl1_13054 [Pistacia atlantica]|uniref:Uncharacterized protein n=1 Tax=Pistacia atlantica TaxID=434234 RepID=A0ACC1ATG0_9ROSI|nr:hypothetical protein Patl1_13054 [Pistacia atlantica]
MENEQVKKQPKRGLWKPEEDLLLKNYVETHGEGNWAAVSEKSDIAQGISEEESNNLTDTTTGSLNYDTELCGVMIPPNNGTFVFDDEPFITYLDSFVLFECMGSEDTYSQSQMGMGMQSIMP